MKKEANLKEKLRQALASTIRVISDDLEIKIKPKDNKSSKKFDFFELDNLNNKNDFIKARAEADSTALKKKFSDNIIYKRNLPSNSNCRSLYSIAEKIRYVNLGGKMLKGIEKNFKNNYNQIVNLKKIDQLKTKEDVPVAEAFELYMLKNFHNIKLNLLSSKILNFWEKEFDKSINQHINFLKNSFEDQNTYSSRFSKILRGMDVFQSEDNEENKEENQDGGQENSSNNDQESEAKDQKDKNKSEEIEASLDSDYDIDEHKIDEQLADADSEQKNSEQIIQKKNIKFLGKGI
jgi:cobaltochelatase CobT